MNPPAAKIVDVLNQQTPSGVYRVSKVSLSG